MSDMCAPMYWSHAVCLSRTRSPPMYLTWPRIPMMYGSSCRYWASYCSSVIFVEFGSFWSVTQRSRVTPRFSTRSRSTAANFCTVPEVVSSRPPCHVMLIDVPVLCTRIHVRAKGLELYGWEEDPGWKEQQR